MTYPGVIFWVLCILAMRSRGPWLYRLFFISWSFGTLAMVPPQLVNSSFFPAWIITCFMTAQTVMAVGPKAYLGALFDFRRLGMLTACTIYCIFSAIMLPRIFAGRIDVITMRLETFGATGLAPSLSNIIQAIYFTLTTLAVANIYFAASEPTQRKALLEAFGWGAAAAVITGLVDMLLGAAGQSALLAPFRNATYVLMVDNEVGDMRRVIGLMSEASAYAALCVSFLSVLAITPQNKAASPWGRWRVPLVVALLLMTYLCTSSGGYVALAFVGMMVLASVAIGALGGSRLAWITAYWIFVLAVAALGVVVFAPQVVDSISHMVTVMVFEKKNSSSYVERSMWNSMAFQAFLQSNGLGAGIGCCRASSWMFAVLGNIGAPGMALMLGFIAQIVFARAAQPGEAGLLRVVKLALLPCFAVISLTSPAVGFGLPVAWLAGLAVALARPAQVRSRAAQLGPLPAAPAAGLLERPS